MPPNIQRSWGGHSESPSGQTRGRPPERIRGLRSHGGAGSSRDHDKRSSWPWPWPCPSARPLQPEPYSWPWLRNWILWNRSEPQRAADRPSGLRESQPASWLRNSRWAWGSRSPLRPWLSSRSIDFAVACELDWRAAIRLAVLVVIPPNSHLHRLGRDDEQRLPCHGKHKQNPKKKKLSKTNQTKWGEWHRLLFRTSVMVHKTGRNEDYETRSKLKKAVFNIGKAGQTHTRTPGVTSRPDDTNWTDRN